MAARGPGPFHGTGTTATPHASSARAATTSLSESAGHRAHVTNPIRNTSGDAPEGATAPAAVGDEPQRRRAGGRLDAHLPVAVRTLIAQAPRR